MSSATAAAADAGDGDAGMDGDSLRPILPLPMLNGNEQGTATATSPERMSESMAVAEQPEGSSRRCYWRPRA